MSKCASTSKDLQHRDAAGRWRPHAADSVLAIRATHRRALLRRIRREIVGGHPARVRIGARRRGDVGGDGAPVQCIGPLGSHCAQHVSERLVAQRRAGGERRAVRGEEIGPRRRLAPQLVRVGGDVVSKPLRDGKAFVRQPDRRRDQVGPGQFAVRPMRRLKHPRRARNANRAAARDRLPERQRIAVAVEEQVRAGGGRRGLPPVPARHPSARRVVMEQHRAAAQPGGLRLHHAERHLHRHRRVHCAAARFQDRQPCRDRAWIRRRDHRGGRRGRDRLGQDK